MRGTDFFELGPQLPNVRAYTAAVSVCLQHDREQLGVCHPARGVLDQVTEDCELEAPQLDVARWACDLLLALDETQAMKDARAVKDARAMKCARALKDARTTLNVGAPRATPKQRRNSQAQL